MIKILVLEALLVCRNMKMLAQAHQVKHNRVSNVSTIILYAPITVVQIQAAILIVFQDITTALRPVRQMMMAMSMPMGLFAEGVV